MGNGEEDARDPEDPATPSAEALPDLNPWREVGWIFRDGDCVAIARDGGDGPPAPVMAE